MSDGPAKPEDYPHVPDETLDELINETRDTAALKDALRNAIVQRNSWVEIANGAECAEVINDEDEAIRILLRGEV